MLSNVVPRIHPLDKRPYIMPGEYEDRASILQGGGVIVNLVRDRGMAEGIAGTRCRHGQS